MIFISFAITWTLGWPPLIFFALMCILPRLSFSQTRLHLGKTIGILIRINLFKQPLNCSKMNKLFKLAETMIHIDKLLKIYSNDLITQCFQEWIRPTAMTIILIFLFNKVPIHVHQNHQSTDSRSSVLILFLWVIWAVWLLQSTHRSYTWEKIRNL